MTACLHPSPVGRLSKSPATAAHNSPPLRYTGRETYYEEGAKLPDSVPFNVARERNDIVLKRLGAALRGHLLHRFGLTLPAIVETLPNDLPVLGVRSQRADLVFRLADGSLLHLEFQSSNAPTTCSGSAPTTWRSTYTTARPSGRWSSTAAGSLRRRRH